MFNATLLRTKMRQQKHFIRFDRVRMCDKDLFDPRKTPNLLNVSLRKIDANISHKMQNLEQ